MPQLEPIAIDTATLVLGLLLLLFEAFGGNSDRRTFTWAGITGLGALLALSFFSAPHVGTPEPAEATGYHALYTADPLAMFFKQFSLLTTLIVLIMALDYRHVVRRFVFANENESGLGEFSALPVLTCAGLMFMASAVDFSLIFVSLELVTVSFYVLVAFNRRHLLSLEAGIKYLILAGLSTGFLVYGIAWIFGVTGTTNLARMPGLAENAPVVPLLFGVLLVLVGLGFKIAAVPFQIWVPDVYQGAPTPVTAFLSVGSKALGFVVLLRVFGTFLAMPELQEKLIATMAGLALLTLIYGNLAALPQTNLKRLLAYSSIAHAGYLLVAVASLSPEAVSFYLAAYLLMTLLSFLIMIAVGTQVGGDDISDFNGLIRRSPMLAIAMLIAMLSLAGLPFTIGFIGKFLVFAAAIEQRMFLLVGVGAIAVACGFYYYLKVVRAMFWEESMEGERLNVSALTKFAIIVLAALTIFFGIYPQPVFAMMH